LSIVGESGLVVDRAERRRVLEAVAAAFDRRRERGERVVADVRDGGLGEEDRLVERRGVRVRLGENVARGVEQRLEDLRVESVMRDVRRELEPSGAREG